MRRFLLFLAFAAPLSAATSPTPSGAAPNVLLIMADDLGYSDLGCYGSEIATPHLDGLAQNGLRFTQFYNTARCWPTRAAVLAGYYAQQVRRDGFGGRGGGGNRGVRPAWAPLLPVRLKPLGYRSFHSGKWHIDGKPLDPRNGFDRAYTLDDHDRFFAPRRHTEDDKELPPVQADAGYYSSTFIADHAIKCLREHAEKYRDRPFFGQITFNAPHFPLHAPAADIARYKDRYTRGWDALRQERWERIQKMGLVRGTLPPIEREVGPPYAFPDAIEKLGPNEVNRPLAWDQLTPAQREFQATKMAIHAAMVDRMDREIGRILQQLRTMGALENTLILFHSDNGASAEIMVRGDGHDQQAPMGSGATYLCLGPGGSSLSNTPFRRHKTWVHEGGISTPLIAHWPNGITARGELRHTPTHLIDVVPTVLELAKSSGGTTSASSVARAETAVSGPPMPGRSLVSAFKSDATLKRDSLWFLHEGNRALRVGDWKIVAAGADGPWELYHLATDRGETRNLAAQHADKVKELAAQWTRETEDYRKWAEKDAPPEPPAPKANKKKKA